MTIQLGYWLIPLFISIAAFTIGTIRYNKEKGMYLDQLGFLMYYGAATIVTLASWLAWALL